MSSAEAWRRALERLRNANPANCNTALIDTDVHLHWIHLDERILYGVTVHEPDTPASAHSFCIRPTIRPIHHTYIGAQRAVQRADTADTVPYPTRPFLRSTLQLRKFCGVCPADLRAV